MLRLIEVGTLVGVWVVVSGRGGRGLSGLSRLVQVEVVVVLVGIAALRRHTSHAAARGAIVVVAVSLAPVLLVTRIPVLEAVSPLPLARSHEPRRLVQGALATRTHVRQGERMVSHHAALAALLHLGLVEVVRRPLVLSLGRGSQRWQGCGGRLCSQPALHLAEPLLLRLVHLLLHSEGVLPVHLFRVP